MMCGLRIHKSKKYSPIYKNICLRVIAADGTRHILSTTHRDWTEIDEQFSKYAITHGVDLHDITQRMNYLLGPQMEAKLKRPF